MMTPNIVVEYLLEEKSQFENKRHSYIQRILQTNDMFFFDEKNMMKLIELLAPSHLLKVNQCVEIKNCQVMNEVHHLNGLVIIFRYEFGEYFYAKLISYFNPDKFRIDVGPIDYKFDKTMTVSLV
jgi:hypothetical protein